MGLAKKFISVFVAAYGKKQTKFLANPIFPNKSPSYHLNFDKVKKIDWSKVVAAFENLVKNYLPIWEGPITLNVSGYKNVNMHSKVVYYKILKCKTEYKISTSNIKTDKKGKETSSEEIFCCDGKLEN